MQGLSLLLWVPRGAVTDAALGLQLVCESPTDKHKQAINRLRSSLLTNIYHLPGQ
jgi:hypothetical protein